MASEYPNNLDDLNTAHVTNETIVAGTDNDQADAINKIEEELGTNPSGGQATVGDRISRSEGLYLGAWNALTNSPALDDDDGTQGDFYQVTASGTQNLGSGSIEFRIGDFAVYDADVWQKVPGVLSGFTYGTAFANQKFDSTAASTTAVVADWTWIGTFIIPPGHHTITGLAYGVGSTSTGTVKSVLYDPSGNKIAQRTTGVAQAAINTFQQVAFDSPVTITGGRYAGGFSFSSGSSTFKGAASAFGLLATTLQPTTVNYATFGFIGVPLAHTY